jgi:hypothetical protein
MELAQIFKSLLGLLNPEMILEILKTIKPDLTDQIDKEIMAFRKEREDDRAKFKEALAKMDIPALNAFSDKFFN